MNFAIKIQGMKAETLINSVNKLITKHIEENKDIHDCLLVLNVVKIQETQIKIGPCFNAKHGPI